MKYIRTKDGIINRDFALPHMVVDGYIDFNSRGRFKIIKQSDSIEELCDEFHGVIKGEGPVPHFEGYNLKDVLFEVKRYGHSVEDTDIYGAIWTDKGLIYVAKINEKGELELL